MADNSYKFDMPPHQKSIIKVIGVGGGGSNAVNHMFNQGIRDVEFFVCNTDMQALDSSPVPNKLQIGINLTEGLGAGANPEKGKQAALESKEDIREMLSDGTKMVFITAGMGGGTGTGAAPIIANVARELGILTVGIVTSPFSFEGKKKAQLAVEGISNLKNACDTVLVILNDKLREIYGNLPIREAFAEADNVLTTAAKGIAEIITVPGYVNVDFEDVKTVMSNAGTAVMGSAIVEGENRAIRAAELAISSPLLDDKNIHGAERILLSIISGEEAELQMDELAEITDYIQEIAGDEAEVIFGHGIDPDLGQKIRVTVITTGFEKSHRKAEAEKRQRIIDLDSNRQLDIFPEDEYIPKTKVVNNDAARVPNYRFESPDTSEERPSKRSQQEDDFVSGLEGFEIIRPMQASNLANNMSEPESPKKPDDIEMKKDILRKQAEERVKKLKELKSGSHHEQDFRDKWDTPAYMRRNVNLQKVPLSSESNISRYNLNDDNQILGNNKFLHDNVD
ncbi:MAG: cell division protein FtsZ [Cyclobacteriaceae bacterium]